ncbi:disrupted in schizophrenia 1 protein isoform X2 [Grammomys surdaster]|uniref:disrupted in schizophrenia 1 protein isoform X2 n=1 Tax=Grammomys surdaster TaxID=491861 RepID=UPI00109F970C|nr:disrupted in schizophrenia 1 protein isoform X2 [Grammomys surdaster]
MQGGGPRGAPIQGPSHGADSGHSSPPAVAPQRRRVTRRPGYMRSPAGPGIRFLSPAVGMLRSNSAGLTGQEPHHSQPKAGQCGLDPRSHCQAQLVGKPFLKSSLGPAVASVGHMHPAQGCMRERPVHFGVRSRNESRQSERLTGPCKPGDSACWQEFLSSDSAKSLAPGLHVSWSKESRGLKTVKSLAPVALNGLADVPSLPGFQDTFTSSFSFIRLSLGAAGERGEAEGCLPSREAELQHQSPQEMAAEASGSDTPYGDPRHLWTFGLHAAPGLVDLAQVTRNSRQPDCGKVSSSDAGFSSQDASSAGGRGDQGGWADDHGWHALLREWEPMLQDYLLSSRRQLEVTSLILKLQKLQEKAVEDGDYDTAETLRQRLEDLEQEKGCLPWALPSQQPALRSFLGYLAAQTRVALHGATQRAGGDDPEATLGQPRTTAQDSLPISVTRRDWLIQEKQQLQKEIEALQARMSVLEAKEQQLNEELEEQETLLQWQGCDQMALVAQLSPGQLQEVSRALGETLTSASQASFHVEPPETLRSLRERTKSLNLAVRELTAQVCSGEKLCSSLRRRLSDLDSRLPALLEAKMLALSGSCFSTAKELTEEVWALSSEREGLETLLDRLLTLSSRNVRRLGSVKEDYLRCRQDLVLQEAAHKTCVKANTVKCMEVLEGQLSSCRCPVLRRVWQADLEACQLLMQSLQLQEAGSTPHAGDEKQVHSTGEASQTAALAVPRTPHPEEEKSPLQESHVISAEVGEKCEAIGVRLLHLEDQLHKAMHSHDEALFQSLQGELQMVKETLQAMILQLQPTKEAEGEVSASCSTAGTQEAEA